MAQISQATFDLIAPHLREGKSRAEVCALTGKSRSAVGFVAKALQDAGEIQPTPRPARTPRDDEDNDDDVEDANDVPTTAVATEYLETLEALRDVVREMLRLRRVIDRRAS